MNVNPAVGEDPPFPVDIANLGRSGDHALQPLGGVCHGQARHSSSLRIRDCCAAPKERKLRLATNFYTPKSGKFPNPGRSESGPNCSTAGCSPKVPVLVESRLRA